MDGDRWATVVGFAGALLVLGLMVWLVGVDDVVAALADIQYRYLAVLVAIAVAWLAAWGQALRTVLGALDRPISRTMATLVFAGAMFSNNVTPFGQAGGEPLSAYLISEATDSEYETGLAAIASVDALHFVPSIGFAVAGLTFVAAGAVRLGRNLIFASAAVAVLVVGFPTAAYLGWRYRYELEALVVRVVTPVVRVVGRVVPWREPPHAADVENRIERFFAAVDRVAGNRRTLLEVVGFSALGWLALTASLWVSLFALGHPVAYAAVLLVIPMGSIAGMTPLPGGLGGVEAVLVALLVSTTGITPAVASAAVLVHRGATYWLPTVVGGGTAFSLGLTDR